ncbi:MAG: hypothetical protein Q3M30_06500 [Candidatus Electrothrix sp. Rat3]|nr:hypothetical protein [Candidatus Electrothrix rattekaaiensis]
MINKKSFAIVSLILVTLPFLGAICLDTFTTAFLAVPAILYLSAVILKAASFNGSVIFFRCETSDVQSSLILRKKL